MTVSQHDAHEQFEHLLRQRITQTVIGRIDREITIDDLLIARLRRYEHLARTEKLSSQTLQVISAARRLLGDTSDPRHGP